MVWKQLNNQKPIWTREPTKVSDAEYAAFYKVITKGKDTQAPRTWNHFHVEGQLEFRSVLFVPSTAPYDVFQKRAESNNIRLYVRRVFITDDCKDLIPEYLSFVRGVVDSEDLPLNVSRELLQQNTIMKVIRKHLVKKCLDMLYALSQNDEASYLKFYESFSKNLKLGVHEDSVNRTKLTGLLRFQTSTSDTKYISLDTCIERRIDKTSPIYYMVGENIESVQSSPLLEKLYQLEHEVVFMTDALDEYVMQQVTEYSGCKLVSASKEGLDLSLNDIEKENMENSIVHLQPLCEAVKKVLGDNVEKVILSKRIVSSPCCLVSGQYGWTANMERIMKAQALGDDSMMSFMGAKRTLELNPNHATIQALFSKLVFVSMDENSHDVGDGETVDIEDGDDFEKTKNVKTLDESSINHIRDSVWLLYDSCTLGSGFNIKDIPSFMDRINNIVKHSLV